MYGAAWAFAASYTILPVLMYRVSRSYYKIRYEFKRLIQIAAVSMLLFGASTVVNKWTLPIWPTIGFKALIVFMYFPLLFSIGFFSTREKIKLRYLWQKAMAIPR
jgi:hypothetical protein